MQKIMKLSLSGLVVVFVMGGALFAISQQMTPNAANQRTRNNSANGTAQVLIQDKTAKPLYSAQQQDLARLAEQLVQFPPQQPFDASKFTQYVYQQAGLSLPRTIAEQSQVGTKIMSSSNLQEGDLVFFDLNNSPATTTFVGIYLTKGRVAAYTTHGLRTFNMNSGYWANKFLYGTRLT